MNGFYSPKNRQMSKWMKCHLSWIFNVRGSISCPSFPVRAAFICIIHVSLSLATMKHCHCAHTAWRKGETPSLPRPGHSWSGPSYTLRLAPTVTETFSFSIAMWLWLIFGKNQRQWVSTLLPTLYKNILLCHVLNEFLVSPFTLVGIQSSSCATSYIQSLSVFSSNQLLHRGLFHPYY